MPTITLSKQQWQRLSEILGNLGLVFLASVVLPYILEEPKLLTIISGLILVAISWVGSIIVAGKLK